MCHMLADTTEELLAMANRIGLQHKWIQKAGTPEEHFDVSLSRRKLAIQFGAIEIDKYKLVAILKSKREEPPNAKH